MAIKEVGSTTERPIRTTTRAARLNRRRYLEITRLLKEVVGDKKAGLARRMRAADMLLGVYDRHDKALERKALRVTEAQEAKGTGTPQTAPEPEPVTPKEETVDEFLARIASRTAGKTTGTTAGVSTGIPVGVTELDDEEDDEELDDAE